MNAGPFQDAVARVAVMAAVGRDVRLAGHHLEGVRVEPLVDGRVVELAAADAVRPHGAVERVERVVLRDREREAGAQRPDAVGLPAARGRRRPRPCWNAAGGGDLVNPVASPRCACTSKPYAPLVGGAVARVLVGPAVDGPVALVAPVALAQRLAERVGDVELQPAAEALLAVHLQARGTRSWRRNRASGCGSRRGAGPPGPSTMELVRARRCCGVVGSELRPGSGLFSSTVLSRCVPLLPT